MCGVFNYGIVEGRYRANFECDDYYLTGNKR
jgi:hypothetical protein